jgi:hypothetical protein
MQISHKEEYSPPKLNWESCVMVLSHGTVVVVVR